MRKKLRCHSGRFHGDRLRDIRLSYRARSSKTPPRILLFRYRTSIFEIPILRATTQEGVAWRSRTKPQQKTLEHTFPGHDARELRLLIFFHPDYTVGFGIAPNQHPRIDCFAPVRFDRISSRTFTAGRESHPALKILFRFALSNYSATSASVNISAFKRAIFRSTIQRARRYR